MNDKKKPVEEEVLPVEPPPKTIKLVPVEGAYIQGVPAVPMEVSPERAKELLAYSPPAFKKA